MEQNTVVDKKTRCSTWRKDAKDKTEPHTVALGAVPSLKNCRAACGSMASTSVQNKTKQLQYSFHFSLSRFSHNSSDRYNTAMLCDSTQGLFKNNKRVCTESGLLGKNISLAILGSWVCIGSVLDTTLSNWAMSPPPNPIQVQIWTEHCQIRMLTFRCWHFLKFGGVMSLVDWDGGTYRLLIQELLTSLPPTETSSLLNTSTPNVHHLWKKLTRWHWQHPFCAQSMSNQLFTRCVHSFDEGCHHWQRKTLFLGILTSLANDVQ